MRRMPDIHSRFRENFYYGEDFVYLYDELSSPGKIGLSRLAKRGSMARSAWSPREVSLSSNNNTTRPLCTLPGPTIRSIPDRKMVTECAKCGPGRLGAGSARYLSVLPFAHETRNLNNPQSLRDHGGLFIAPERHTGVHSAYLDSAARRNSPPHPRTVNTWQVKAPFRCHSFG